MTEYILMQRYDGLTEFECFEYLPPPFLPRLKKEVVV